MLDLLAASGLHEFYTQRSAASVAASGFCLASLSQTLGMGSVLWIRHDMGGLEAGEPYAPGIEAYGLRLDQFVVVRARDPVAVLQAGLEAARTPGLKGILLELWGETRAYDLTASRRLALAARTSGLSIMMARVAAAPQPSAAETRWALGAAPSRILAARSPGWPSFDLTLLRARSGREGMRLLLEWNRDDRRFALSQPSDLHAGPDIGGTAAPLSGVVAPFPAHRQAAPPLRRAG